MSLGVSRASTQDNSGGTQVASTTNEDGSAGIIQLNAIVGNKTVFAEASRTAITVVDAPTGGNLTTTGTFAGSAGANLADMGNAPLLQVRATCGTASATMTGRVVFYDASNSPIGYSEIISFTADPTLRLGNAAGDFVSQRQIIEAGTARKFEFFILTISAGSWSVYARPL